MADEESRAEDADDGERSAPLGDLAERVRSQRSATEGAAIEREGEEDGFGLEEFFQEETYEEIDADDLWSSLDAEPDEPSSVDTETEPNEHVVPKRSYCEPCQHFSDPPDVHCTHPGTTILEFVDIDHVRLRNCPVVAERLLIGGEEDEAVAQDAFSGQ